MKLSYFADTDLLIDLRKSRCASREASSGGRRARLQRCGRLVGIDTDEASKRVRQMDKLVLSQLPSTVETAAA